MTKQEIKEAIEDIKESISAAASDAASAVSEAQDAENNADRAYRYLESLEKELQEMTEDMPLHDSVVLLLHALLPLNDDLAEMTQEDLECEGSEFVPRIGVAQRRAREVLKEIHEQPGSPSIVSAGSEQARIMVKVVKEECEDALPDHVVALLKSLFHATYIAGTSHRG